jgi:hypothetical protein
LNCLVAKLKDSVDKSNLVEKDLVLPDILR